MRSRWEASQREPNQCWDWVGPKDKDGYARHRHFMVHRLVYEDQYGPIPQGRTVDHICWNAGCVNPAHLRLLTRSENSRRQRSALKTHCKNGHPYTPSNTYLRPGSGSRDCRACIRDRVRRYHERKSA